MKELAELFGALALIAAMLLGSVLFVALLYGAIFGSIGGVIYLVVKGIMELFQ